MMKTAPTVKIAMSVPELLNEMELNNKLFKRIIRDNATVNSENYYITEQEMRDALFAYHQQLLSRIDRVFNKKPSTEHEYLTTEHITHKTVITPDTLQPIIKAFFNFNGMSIIRDSQGNVLLPRNNIALFKVYLWNNFPRIAPEIVMGAIDGYSPVKSDLPIVPKDNQYISLNDIYHICDIEEFTKINLLSSGWLIKLYETHVYFNGKFIPLKTSNEQIIDKTLSLAILEKFPTLKIKLKTFWEEFNKTNLEEERAKEKSELALAIELATKHLNELNRKYAEL